MPGTVSFKSFRFFLLPVPVEKSSSTSILLTGRQRLREVKILLKVTQKTGD